MGMTINCDMGEGFGLYRMGDDAALMPHIDLANVACGFHAGDPGMMRATVRSAKQHQVKVGAHPSLPDLQGFGRRAMVIAPQEVTDLVTYQVGALVAFLQAEDMPLNHVKPHGALYSMAAKDEAIALAVADAVKPFGVPILGMAGTAHERAYKARGVKMIPEFYADLDYDGDGNLIISRSHEAVDPAKARDRVLRVICQRVVATTGGHDIPVEAATICVHSDTPTAPAIAAEVSRTLRQMKAGN
ncbi:MAG: 5-oxoprolinase subunit PxpA [Pseudolabrys sp.]